MYNILQNKGFKITDKYNLEDTYYIKEDIDIKKQPIKEIFNKYSKVDSSLSKLPFIPKEYLPKFKLIANITPSKEELEENNRARSSRLRVIERIED